MRNELINKVLERSAKCIGLSVEQIRSYNRENNIAISRHILIYSISKIFSELSDIDLGRLFKRNRITILNSIKQVEDVFYLKAKMNYKEKNYEYYKFWYEHINRIYKEVLTNSRSKYPTEHHFDKLEFAPVVDLIKKPSGEGLNELSRNLQYKNS